MKTAMRQVTAAATKISYHHCTRRRSNAGYKVSCKFKDELGGVLSGFILDRQLGQMPGKALKLTNAERQRRYGVVVQSVEDLKRKGTEKFPSDQNISDINLVLDEDGTIVDTDAYVMAVPDHTLIMMLKPGEVWQKQLSADKLAHSWDSVDAVDQVSLRYLETGRLTPAESDRIRVLASRIRREGLATFITFSNDDFQLIAGMLPKDLAAVLGESEEEVLRIQELCHEHAVERQAAMDSVELLKIYKAGIGGDAKNV